MDMRGRVNAALKQAMKDKATGRLSTLRLINAAIKDKDIEARGSGANGAPKRCTRPPSWSTAIKTLGDLILRISPQSSVTCERLSKLRLNRITPPTAGLAMSSRSTGESVWPSTSSMSGPSATGQAARSKTATDST